MGRRAEQVVDFQALVGDSVDNVPGVPLIGPKFARQLLEQYGSLESVLDHAGRSAGAKRKENLQKFRDQALLSRELVRLDAHVPVAIDWKAARPGRIDLAAALALFREFGFRSIGQRVTALAKARDEARGSANRPSPADRPDRPERRQRARRLNSEDGVNRKTPEPSPTGRGDRRVSLNPDPQSLVPRSRSLPTSRHVRGIRDVSG